MTVLRLLYRVEMDDLLVWSNKALLAQINHNDKSVGQMALSILEEICEDEDNIQFLLRDISYLPEAPSSSQYMMQYLMTEEGFHYLMSKNCIEEQLDLWMNQEKWKYVENFDFKVMQYLDLESNETQQSGYRYVTYHSLTNPHFSYTSVYLATIMRLPWNIYLSLQTTQDNKEEGGNNIKNVCLKINVEYNAKDDYLIVTGDIKPGLTDDFDAYDIKTNLDKNWVINTSLMIGDTHLNNSC